MAARIRPTRWSRSWICPRQGGQVAARGGGVGQVRRHLDAFGHLRVEARAERAVALGERHRQQERGAARTGRLQERRRGGGLLLVARFELLGKAHLVRVIEHHQPPAQHGAVARRRGNAPPAEARFRATAAFPGRSRPVGAASGRYRWRPGSACRSAPPRCARRSAHPAPPARRGAGCPARAARSSRASPPGRGSRCRLRWAARSILMPIPSRRHRRRAVRRVCTPSSRFIFCHRRSGDRSAGHPYGRDYDNPAEPRNGVECTLEPRM